MNKLGNNIYINCSYGETITPLLKKTDYRVGNRTYGKIIPEYTIITELHENLGQGYKYKIREIEL